MLLSNRNAAGDTWSAWRFYRRVREQFTDWNHVVLDHLEPEESGETSPAKPKLVRFVDDRGDVLELAGVNFGYDGDTPGELLKLLIDEGFNESVSGLVLQQGSYYPLTIPRD